MKKYFAQLRPMERRLAVGVLVLLLLVLNFVYIWPRLSDWGKWSARMTSARQKLDLYQKAVAQTDAYAATVKNLESDGAFIAQEDQAVNLMRAVQSQSSQSGVGIVSTARSVTRTNDAFFIEQIQNLSVIGTDQQIVDFLYKLGSSASMIRVRDLEMQPDNAKQRLNANIQLVASYQKNPNPPAAAQPAPVAKAALASTPKAAASSTNNSKTVTKPAK